MTADCCTRPRIRICTRRCIPNDLDHLVYAHHLFPLAAPTRRSIVQRHALRLGTLLVVLFGVESVRGDLVQPDSRLNGSAPFAYFSSISSKFQRYYHKSVRRRLFVCIEHGADWMPCEAKGANGQRDGRWRDDGWKRGHTLFGSLTSTYLPSSFFLTKSTTDRTMPQPLVNDTFIWRAKSVGLYDWTPTIEWRWASRGLARVM